MRIRKFGCSLVFQTLLCMLSANAFSDELRIVVEPSELTVEQGVFPKFKTFILNEGADDRLLVYPGDGSRNHYRSPMTGCSILDSASLSEHPSTPPQIKVAVCGNINALKKDSVFTLKSGQKMELDAWRSMIALTDLKPGVYRVVYYYSNHPEMEWKGGVLGNHDEEEMRLVKKSYRCELVSNEIKLTVVKPKQSNADTCNCCVLSNSVQGAESNPTSN